MSVDIMAIIPEIVLVCFGFLVLMLSVFIGRGFDRAIAPLAVLGLAASAAAIFVFNFSRLDSFFSLSFIVDDYSIFFRLFTLITAIIIVSLSVTYIKDSMVIKRNMGEFYFLILMVTVGTMLMSAAGDLIMLFISLELVSMPLYILAGYEKTNEKSNEASLKYFILGVLASGILVYGFSLIYGATGKIILTEISEAIISGGMIDGNYLLITGIIMALTGFGFKIAAAPFHFWAPDTYEGSPTIITVLITTIAKLAAFAGLIRFLYMGISNFSSSLWIILFIVALSLLSMILGNLMALPQKNFKRLMAYSSIAHGGYMMIAFVAATEGAQWAVFLYLMAYILMNLGVFAVAMLVEKTRRSEEISAFAGIGQSNPFISICMIIFLVSMVGLPPFAGFLGKLFVFKAGIEANLTWLVIIAVLTSVISLYYYMNIIKHMYFIKYDGDRKGSKVRTSKVYLAVISFCAVGTILMLVLPSIFISIAENAVVTGPGF
ncbi:MAG: NADH-quinone oxidoreductase subunit N [Actinobacteria bacterium]|nr:NADH-quinone oxidoreductase subunit N [Actinomycetota bacterium]